MSALIRFAVAALLAAISTPLTAAPPPGCKLVKVAEWPVQLRNGLPILEGSINGKKIGILLDTGAFASLVTKSSLDRLGLATRETAGFISGFGGESRILLTRIDEFRLGNSVRKGLRVRVGGERALPGVDFILGGDFFRELDIEFDYAQGVVRLFQPVDCKGSALSYWDPGALQVPLEDGDWMVMPVSINGKAGRAMLDSGASSSVLGLSLAARAGVTPESPGVVPSGCSAGLGADLVRSWVGKFDSIEIGGEAIREANLHMSDMMSQMIYNRSVPEMILGTDFLRSHRVYVARSQRKVYFSYLGGQVFPATPALDCDDRLKDKSPGEARAALDQAIERNPRDAAALAARAALRAKLNDFEGALADSDAAIAAGVRNAQAYVDRGRLHRNNGDLARAMADYDQALLLDPRHYGARRSRARLHFHMGRLDAAEREFAALMEVPHSGYDAIWLSIVRTRTGADDRAMLEKESAALAGAWPAPVLQHYLGLLDAAALISAAEDPDAAKRKSRHCEARYYIAARLIGRGQGAAARPHLEAARDGCPPNYVEYEAAVLEIKRLP